MATQQPISKQSLLLAQDQKSLVTYAKHLFDSGLFSDCTIYSQRRLWHLHRAILAQRCDFFRACFSNKFGVSSAADSGACAVVNMHDDESEAVGRMLRWLYTLEYPLLESISTGNKQQDLLATKTYDHVSQQMRSDEVIHNFWTSELSLFIMADKYGLESLTIKASASLCDAIIMLSWKCKLDVDQNVLQNCGDLKDMLEILYVQSPSISENVRQLQQDFLASGAIVIATTLQQDSGFAELLMNTPRFAQDLIQVLRQIVNHSHSSKSSMVLNGANEGSASPVRSSQSSIYSPGSPIGLSGVESSNGKRYIPMNEDSDVD